MYRKTVFMAKGMREFTKGGYDRAKLSFRDDEMGLACTDRTFIVTGANSGIGKAAATEFVRRGGNVHILCRNPERCRETAEELRQLNHAAQVVEHVVDISDITAVHQFTNTFNQEVGKVDVLVSNAGVLLDKRTETKDHMELSFATNTLGPYVLTLGLLPSLKASSDPRVITVSSGGMYTEKLDLSDVQSTKGSFDGSRAYSQQKRQEVILMEQLSLKYPEILFLSMHPGWADTPGVKTSLPSFHRMLQNNLRTPEEGADTIIWLASIFRTHPALKSGSFYLDRLEAPKHLPLAWTHSAPEEDSQLLSILADCTVKIIGTELDEMIR